MPDTPEAEGETGPQLTRFTVLCRRDAYSDYVAEVEAETAEDAAILAKEDHNAYKWEAAGVAEFDDAVYFTLDKDGAEMETTEVRN
jgi:hypothetical protein